MTNETIIIKKYNNRRLYNTKTSTYINLQDVFDMVRQQVDFIVVDAKTNQDLTHSTIVQIILDQESKGYNLLPTSFLKQIISFYDERSSNLMQSYLENVMSFFKKYQQDALNFNQLSSLKNFEDITKQNLKFFEQAFSFFSQPPNNNKGNND
jgi:polyhydroxyalkanoate synthesis repressor PhaR